MSDNDVKIRTIYDIKKVIVPFIKETKEDKVPLSSEVKWEENGSKNVTKVSAYSSDVSVRNKLLEGFEQVKEQKELWDNLRDTLDDDEFGSSLPEANIDDFNMPVDRIIKHRLGGKREGMTIVWILGNKKIVFNPFSKELNESLID
jgi:hypothetical protein